MRPCSNCPWRKDAPTRYWDPGHFLNIYKTCQGDGLSTMLCHKSRVTLSSDETGLPTNDEKPIICAGWAAVIGFNAIGLRIQAMLGHYNPANLDVRGLELYESLDAMMAANVRGWPKRTRR